MTVMEFGGYCMIAMGPSLCMIYHAILKHPTRIILFLICSFSWLLYTLLVSIVTYFTVGNSDLTSVILCAFVSILIQELFRFCSAILIFISHASIMKLDDKLNPYLVAYICGLSFSSINILLIVANTFPAITGRGTYGLIAGEKFVPLVASLSPMLMGLCNILWTVATTHGVITKSKLFLAFAPVCHLLASFATIGNKWGYYAYTILALLVSALVSLTVIFVGFKTSLKVDAALEGQAREIGTENEIAAQRVEEI